MSTGPADARRRHRPLAALLLLTLLGPTVAACGDDPTPGPDPAAEAAAAIVRTLDQRARALRTGDERSFRRTVARRDARFAAAQATYFDNLAQLPLSVLRLDLDDGSLEEAGDQVWAEVEVRMQLEGYDAAPVVTRDRYRFTRARDGRRWLLTSTTDRAWEAEHRPQQQPWDLGAVEVREEPGVLGVFDAGTIAHADGLLDSFRRGRGDVVDVLPEGVAHGAVVYALADDSYLASVPGLPVDDPDRLDAVTIPVPRDAADPDGPAASYRVLVHPRVLGQPGPALDRLVRHELTHVALGDRARGAPLWITEGVAEYVAVRSDASPERSLPTDALVVAADADGLPGDEQLVGPDAEAWYAVAWWICEHVAATWGEPALWSLLEALADGRDEHEAVVDVLGATPAQLAAEGVGLMQRTYG